MCLKLIFVTSQKNPFPFIHFKYSAVLLTLIFDIIFKKLNDSLRLKF